MKTNPYEITRKLRTELSNVECWNRTDGARFTLPIGTLLKIEHVYDATSTTCMAQQPDGQARETFPGCYRFIVDNQALGKATGVRMPKRTADIVGDIIAYESGKATAPQTRRLFKTLKKTGIGSKLQGHYSSRMTP